MLLALQPACKDYLWGGDRLKTAYGKQFEGEKLAETWELSCHPDGPSTIASGPWKGRPLGAYLKAEPEALGAVPASFGVFPLLIKLIDAAQDLSVQVHPDDTYACAHEQQYGKTEMWYVIDAKPGASMYYGFKRQTSLEEFRTAIRAGTVCDLLNKVEVHPGDVFFIEPGTVHAIGAGILVAEIQESSNVTYRVYDYDRVDTDGKPRALHIEKACQVVALYPASKHQNFGGHLARCRYFTVDKLTIQGTINRQTTGTTFHSLLVLDGSLQISAGAQHLQAHAGDSLFVGADTGDYSLTGQATVLVTFLEQWRYRIGIDLGGTKIKVGIVDPNAQIVATSHRPTLSQRPWEEVESDIVGTVQDALNTAHLTVADCAGAGIGCPGTIDRENGCVIYSNNLEWANVPLAQTLQQQLGLPIRISNDANCAALGETVAGAAHGCRSAVLLTLGTGVGGGVVLDGKLFEGNTGAMELGHVTLIAGGEPCTCGRRGCIESYCSATALIREANRAADAAPDSLLARMRAEKGSMDGRIPFDAMQAGDETARKVIDQYIEWLGDAITDFVNVFRPEVVLLSGGISAQGDVLTKPLNTFVQHHAFGGTRLPVPPVCIAALGNRAGLLGAAYLI